MNLRLHEIGESIKSNPYETSGHIYHPLPFPEFEQLTTSSRASATYRKWSLIMHSLGTPSALKDFRVLDVGANAGFYSFSFAKLGAVVDAYEPHEHYGRIGRQIAEATGLPVCWLNRPLKRADLLDKQYDVALMLSVFQWISHGNQNLEEATNLLRLVASSSRLIFFEIGCNHGKSAICTDERPIGWIWRLLQENTIPKEVVYLGSTNAWGRARRYVFASTGVPVNLTFRQRLMTCILQRRWLR